MRKNIIATVVALVAFAAMPALASASPALTDEGKLLAPGAKVLATQSGNITFSGSIGTFTCAKSTLTGTLRTNTGTHIEETLEKVTFTNEAGGPVRLPYPSTRRSRLIRKTCIGALQPAAPWLQTPSRSVEAPAPKERKISNSP
jgi:hypothetical protein